ncbi:hypothetical protein M441DRAFT_266779 [Trichoderma asperellum CBS 433.97]|uniref:Uncharacterized protein n=1 Tax=Trichoderma asperellum (strain ATCC 204424 / CBS 433.97 / NBRC 101777) TaxID=1042311 RepID=A0A2T3YXY6_TRIA4|nr:hypothetical protein M441DRAFT_266779 [Trichoderma asperellum CBS 433.97]PTB37433.1 hypothetical protein M441DRAFT_266779 [Trichoderma asperellum CBS 433.97]
MAETADARSRGYLPRCQLPLLSAQDRHVDMYLVPAPSHLSHTSTLSSPSLSRALQRRASSFWRKPPQTHPLVAKDAACQPIDTIPGQTSSSYKYCLHARTRTRTLETLSLLCISIVLRHCLIWRGCPSHWPFSLSAPAKLSPRGSAESRPSASLATSPGRLRVAHPTQSRSPPTSCCGCVCMSSTPLC